MTDLERVELAARRTASNFGANGTHESDLIEDVFIKFADELAELIKWTTNK